MCLRSPHLVLCHLHLEVGQRRDLEEKSIMAQGRVRDIKIAKIFKFKMGGYIKGEHEKKPSDSPRQ